MNQISNLIGKKFNNLSAAELFQVISAYCEQNKYDFDFDFEYKTRKEVEIYFISNFYPIFELETFFNFWAF
jgi:hypothetical protein